MNTAIMDIMAVMAAIFAVLSLVLRIYPSLSNKIICYFFGHKLVKFLPGLPTESRIRICDRCYMHHHEDD